MAVRVLFQVRGQRHKRHRDGESNCLITHWRSHSPTPGEAEKEGLPRPLTFKRMADPLTFNAEGRSPLLQRHPCLVGLGVRSAPTATNPTGL